MGLEIDKNDLISLILGFSPYYTEMRYLDEKTLLELYDKLKKRGEKKMTKQNIKLTASSAYRFNHCPGSVKLSENTPPDLIFRSAADAAELGSKIHDIGETSIKAVLAGKKPPTIAKLLKEHAILDKDKKDRATTAAREYVKWFKKTLRKNNGCSVFIEEKVRIHRGPFEYVFKADCLIEAGDTLIIADLKTGNFDYTESTRYQLEFSAAVYQEHKKKKFDKIIGVIVQPNYFGSEKIVEISLDVNAVFYLNGLENLIVTDKIEPGDHCTFCNALLTCPYMRNMADIITKYSMMGNIEDINDDTLQEIYLNTKQIKGFLTSVEGVLEAKLNGNNQYEKIMLKPSYGWRKWVDTASVEKELSDFGQDIYESKKLLSPAKMTKLVGKTRIEGLTKTPEYLKIAKRESDFDE